MLGHPRDLSVVHPAFSLSMSRVNVAGLTDLPDHLLQDVIHAYLYRENQFADEVEALPSSNRLLMQRYEIVARSIMPCCKRFYGIAVRELWRSIVIRTAKDLLAVAKRAAIGGYLEDLDLTGLVKRLELHISPSMDFKVLHALLDCLTELEVLIILDTPAMTQVGSLSILSLFSQPTYLLRRVQLEADHLVPSCTEVIEFMCSNPSLLTLGVKRMSVINAADRATASARKIPRSLSLRSLAFGDVYADNPPADVDPFGLLLTWLAKPDGRRHRPARQLREIEASIFPSSFHMFLQTYGLQLRRVQFAASAYHVQYHIAEPQWTSLCPNLEQLDWVVTGTSAVLAPPIHPDICTASVIYSKSRFESRREAIDGALTPADAFRNGHYPRLSSIELTIRGDGVPYQENIGRVRLTESSPDGGM